MIKVAGSAIRAFGDDDVLLMVVAENEIKQNKAVIPAQAGI